MKKQDTIHTSQDATSTLTPVGYEIPVASTIKAGDGETRHVDTGAKEYGKPSQREVFEEMLASGELTLATYPKASTINKEIGRRWSAAHGRPDAGNCQFLVNRTRAGYTPDTDTGCWRLATPEEEKAYLATLGTGERAKAISGLLLDGEVEKLQSEIATLQGTVDALPDAVKSIIVSRIDQLVSKVTAHKSALASMAASKASRDMRAGIMDKVTALVKEWQAQGGNAPLIITVSTDGAVA